MTTAFVLAMALTAAEPLPADLELVPRDALFFLSARVADGWNSELGKAWREHVAKQDLQFLKEIEEGTGVEFGLVERFTLVARGISGAGIPDYDVYFLITTVAPAPRAAILQAIVPGAKEAKYRDHSYFAGKPRLRGRPDHTAVWFVNDRLFMVSTGKGVTKVLDELATKKMEGPLSDALRIAAEKHTLVAGMNPARIADLGQGEGVPSAAKPLLPLLKARRATVVLDVGKDTRLDGRLTFPQADGAQEGEKALQAAVVLACEGAAEFQKSAKLDEPDQRLLALLFKLVEPALQSAKVNRREAEVQVQAGMKSDIQVVSAALADSAIRIRNSAHFANSINNLRQIAIALHNYHDTHGHLPPAVVTDKQGKPLYSWRVLLLPYLDQDELYKQFNLEEPWDSEHNKTLLAKIPPVYAPVTGRSKVPFGTYFQAVYGKGAAFEGTTGKRIPADFPDGTSNTIWVVEAGEAVPWTKPADVDYAPDKPLPKLGGLLPALPSFNVALVDGSVRAIKRTISEKTLRGAFTPNGLETLGPDF